MHQGLKRIGCRLDLGGHFMKSVRAILHGAIAIYVIRYLNVPPARLPGEGDDGLEIFPQRSKKSVPLCWMPSIADIKLRQRRASWRATSR